MKKKLIIIGAGGFAKAVIDSLNHDVYDIFGFIDSYKSGYHQGIKIISNDLFSLNSPQDFLFFIAIGDPNARSFWLKKIESYGFATINVIDPTSIISKNAVLGKCIYVGKMAIINCDVNIDDGVVINTRALVEHGNKVGYCSNVSTNVVLNGDVQVGERTFIGSSTVVNGQIKIGSDTIIGSGSVVIRDIPNNVIVAGSPTRLLKEKK